MVSKIEKDLLLEISYGIIDSERLPKCDIKFRETISGNRKRMGVCQHTHIENKYTILVNMVKAKFFKCEHGKYVDKKTGERYSKSCNGEALTIKQIVNILAHEIAHLKFWQHTPQHLSYTTYLENKILESLKFHKVNID